MVKMTAPPPPKLFIWGLSFWVVCEGLIQCFLTYPCQWKRVYNFQFLYDVEDRTFVTVTVPTEIAVCCYWSILDFECLGTFSYDFPKIVYFEVAKNVFLPNSQPTQHFVVLWKYNGYQNSCYTFLKKNLETEKCQTKRPKKVTFISANFKRKGRATKILRESSAIMIIFDLLVNRQ